MITIKNLEVRYNGYKALSIEELEIPTDRTTCILGPNGAGKTTLLKTMIKQAPYRGEIRLGSEDLSVKKRRELARIFSYASPIQPSPLFNLRVIDALMTARYIHSRGFFEKYGDLEQALRIAETMGIKDLLNRRLETLSSGELQRVVLAMAILKDTSILLLDEPDSHIDPGSKAELIRILRELSESKTIIFTTHDVIFGTQLGEYFIVINRGRTVFTGNYRELAREKRVLEKAYGVRIAEYRSNDTSFLVPLYL